MWLDLQVQRRLQAAPGQRRQLQFQQDQVVRIEAGMHRSLRMPQAQRRQRVAAMNQHLALVQLRPVQLAVAAQTFKRRQAHPKLHVHAPILVHTRCTRTPSSRYSRQSSARKSTALPSACT